LRHVESLIRPSAQKNLTLRDGQFGEATGVAGQMFFAMVHNDANAGLEWQGSDFLAQTKAHGQFTALAAYFHCG
jgi:hypothetical protein